MLVLTEVFAFSFKTAFHRKHLYCIGWRRCRGWTLKSFNVCMRVSTNDDVSERKLVLLNRHCICQDCYAFIKIPKSCCVLRIIRHEVRVFKSLSFL